MKKIFVFILFVISQFALNAQVDIELRPNSPNIEVWIKPRGFVTNDLITGIQFTIKWPTTCTGVDLSQSPGSPTSYLSMSYDAANGSLTSGGNNYRLFGGAGSAFNYVPLNGSFIKIMTVAVSGSASSCPFSIEPNPPASLNNNDNKWGADGRLNGSSASTSVMTGSVNTSDVVLPVEILSFTAEKKNNSVALQFVTVKEQNLKEFVIERSGDGSSFSAIGSILPKAKNENEKVTYDFMDDTPDAGINYYRIQSRDINGAFKYSQIVSASFGTANSDFKVFPNPAKTNSSLNIITTWNKEYDFKITDFTGRLIYQQLKINSTNLVIEGLNLASGSYNYEITTSKTSVIGKLIVVE